MPESSRLETAFAGVSNVLVTDGDTTLLVDGFFSRPSLPRLVATRLAPDRERVAHALGRLHVDRLDAVLVSHTHVDHALDSPLVAARTGARLLGSASARMIAVGFGLDVPFDQMRDREPVTVGRFTVTPVHALHSDGDRAPGEITEPLISPARLHGYRTGGCFSLHIAHPDGTVFVHPTANFVRPPWRGWPPTSSTSARVRSAANHGPGSTTTGARPSRRSARASCGPCTGTRSGARSTGRSRPCRTRSTGSGARWPRSASSRVRPGSTSRCRHCGPGSRCGAEAPPRPELLAAQRRLPGERGDPRVRGTRCRPRAARRCPDRSRRDRPGPPLSVTPPRPRSPPATDRRASA